MPPSATPENYTTLTDVPKMNLLIRTVGIATATTKIGMANLVYNMKRLVFLYHLARA
jgi:hypothetical protein